MMIAETASTEVGGDKSVWIAELFEWAAQRRNRKAVVWFHYDKETDWRIDSSAAQRRRSLSG